MEEAAPHTIAPPALALELLARTERYFWLGPTGRWHAVITHFCPLPGQEVAASATLLKKRVLSSRQFTRHLSLTHFLPVLAFFFPHLGSGYLAGSGRGKFIFSGSPQAMS